MIKAKANGQKGSFAKVWTGPVVQVKSSMMALVWRSGVEATPPSSNYKRTQTAFVIWQWNWYCGLRFVVIQGKAGAFHYWERALKPAWQLDNNYTSTASTSSLPPYILNSQSAGRCHSNILDPLSSCPLFRYESLSAVFIQQIIVKYLYVAYIKHKNTNPLSISH